MTSGVKCTYEEVKKYIESFGYKLLSTEYIDAKTKLTVVCPHGHIYEVTFNNFKRGRRCKKCSTKERADNQRLSQEFIENELSKNGYTLLSKEYINANTKLILQDKEGYIYSVRWGGLQQGQKTYKVNSSNPYSLQNIQHYLDLNLKGYKLLSTEYKDNRSELKLKCDKGHEFTSTWDYISRGCKCNVCSGREVTSETCIATTEPWMIKFFKDKEDAYTHSHGSHDIVKVKCPHCGRERKMAIYVLYRTKSIGCVCGDGISYPEKFVISMLNQLDIKYIKEFSPNWIENKRYDFYLENYNCIIECHGGQHYNYGFNYCGGRTLQEEQENDKYKKDLALNNGIDYYIVLDCRKSNLEWIKQSILNSELRNLFDLSKIDWLKCEEYSLKNIVKEVCDYWREYNEINNKELNTIDIGKIFNLERSTICRYLKRGTKLGWCNYDGKEVKSKASRNI